MHGIRKIIEPSIRGCIALTAHPEGCAKYVRDQIAYVTNQPPITSGPKKVLIIGASMGYGLASRIVAAFGARAQTIGVFLERCVKARDHRTASAGWYNTAAFEREANQAGLYAKSINGDAFSDTVKQQTIKLIQEDWSGKVDLVVYSLAAPRRMHLGCCFNSVLKPIGSSWTTKTIEMKEGRIAEVSISPATPQEASDTVSVMGGEDWMLWVDALLKENLLADGAQTVAYSYIGPALTYPIYREGTIGQAKKHLEQTSEILAQRLKPIAGRAFVAINKALVTQASSAIPSIPLYISLLYKVMKEKNLHEGCIEQMYRLYANRLYLKNHQFPLDNLIRMDDWEMREDVQQAVAQGWTKINDENLHLITDLAGYQHDFYKLFGFEIEGIDYSQPSLLDVAIPSLGTAI